MRVEISKTYEAKEVEGRWYQWWESKGYFRADAKSRRPAFSIVIPPPNVTGSLHMGIMLKQIRRIGASCDWSRERFTLDAGLSRAVREVFVQLYEEGLIYRGKRLINWCPRCLTALSDLEVIPEPVEARFYYIKYPLKGRENDFIEVATTRPETMRGDTAVAVNPKDQRYTKYRGQSVILPLMDR